MLAIARRSAFLLTFACAHVAWAGSLSFTADCNLANESLGPGFVGHPTEGLVKALRPVVAPKDEFTTTVAHKKQQQVALQMLGSAVAAGRLCHVVQLKAKLFPPKYDADAGILWVPILVDYVDYDLSGAGQNRVYRDAMDRRNVKETEYPGTNAFGVSKTISKSAFVQSFIQFEAYATRDAVKRVGGEVRDAILSLPLKLPGDQAKPVMKDVAVVIQYELLPPYLTTEHHFERPTLDMPFEEDAVYSLIVAHPTAAAIFQKSTGKVLARFDLTGATPTRADAFN